MSPAGINAAVFSILLWRCTMWLLCLCKLCVHFSGSLMPVLYLVVFVPRRLPLSAYMCMLWQNRLFHCSLNSFEQLVKSLLRHTSWTLTQMDTHLPGREKCVLKQHVSDLALVVSAGLRLQNPMGLIWYHIRACFRLLRRPRAELRGNPSLSV